MFYPKRNMLNGRGVNGEALNKRGNAIPDPNTEHAKKRAAARAAAISQHGIARIGDVLERARAVYASRETVDVLGQVEKVEQPTQDKKAQDKKAQTEKRSQTIWDKPDADLTLRVALSSLPEVDAQNFGARDPQGFEKWKKAVSAALREEFVEFNLSVEYTFATLEHELEVKRWLDEELTSTDLNKVKAEIIRVLEKAAKAEAKKIQYPNSEEKASL